MVELSASSRRGVVVAPHYLAVEAGRGVLAEGGNALEAAIAAAAAIIPAYPHMNHIGGDGFWIIREPSGRIRYVEACGFAGAKATRALYAEHGFKTIPARGPLAALTVPGAVGGWMLACEAAKTTGGKMPLSRLLEPALAIARQGSPVSRSMSWRLAYERATDIKAPGFAETFLIDGKPPREGAVLSTGRLVDTFERLIAAGLDDFYRGDVGREIAADLDRIGSPVTRADLVQYRASTAEPLSVTLQAGTLYNTPPPTQGLASLIILALFERLRVGEAEGFDHVHGIVEATKRAFRVRDRIVTDPDRLPASLERFLDRAFLDAEAEKIDRRKAARWPAPFGEGDTIWMGAADRDGVAVSYIQSLYWEFGSGCVLTATGVLMQNRGASFSLDAGALNALAPGRLPFHTLNPALAVLSDGRVMAYGAMGGDGQPQTQAAVFTRHVLYRVPLADALARPRWLLGRTWGSAITSLRMEDGFDGNALDRLLSAGHAVDALNERYSDTMGHAGAIILHPDGLLEGGHDPRADGGAAGV